MRQANFWSLLKPVYADETTEKPDGTTKETTPEGTAPENTPPSDVKAPNFSLLNNPEVATLVERARTEEKAKLHKDISDTKTAMLKLQELNTGLATQVGSLTVELNTARDNITKLESASKLSTDEKVVALQTALDKATGELSALALKYEALELKQYKEAKIAEAGGKLIVEMVTGRTVEEINASVALAKETFLKYNPDNVDEHTDVVDNTPAPTAPSTPSSRTPQPAPTGSVDLRNLQPLKGRTAVKQYEEVRKTMGFSR